MQESATPATGPCACDSPSYPDLLPVASEIHRGTTVAVVHAGRLLEALAKVELFSEMGPAKIMILADAMIEAPFNKGEWIFHQGDEGDAFYIIIEGEAVVIRDPDNKQRQPQQEPVVLAEISNGAYFGERALIKNQVRYAGVRAKSAKLLTMCVSRSALETALGEPFEHLVPDKYKLDAAELLTSLKSVPLFEKLTSEQLSKIADHMIEDSCKQGSWIFRQGDPGERFYIVTSGTAEVIRMNDETQELETLAVLTRWSTFGERALIMDEARYAGVRASSKLLTTLSMDRAKFEEWVGPVQQFLSGAQYAQSLNPGKESAPVVQFVDPKQVWVPDDGDWADNDVSTAFRYSSKVPEQ